MKEQGERSAHPLWIGVFESPAGWTGAAGFGERLTRIRLPLPGRRRAMVVALSREFPGASIVSAESSPVVHRVARFLSGRGPFPPVDLAPLSPFVREALGWIARIPRGRVASYGRIAGWMGREGAARAVGRASAMNPVPLVIPCHRVVGSNGHLVGFSAHGGTDLKRSLLAAEGIPLTAGERPRVDRPAFLRKPSDLLPFSHRSRL